MLAGSGHIAGVVNPPASGKYQYWTNPAHGDTLESFVAGASETKGSWWPHWQKWIESMDGRRVKARAPDAEAPAAPGSYVHQCYHD